MNNLSISVHFIINEGGAQVENVYKLGEILVDGNNSVEYSIVEKIIKIINKFDKTEGEK